jgi:hypothetical protein
MGCPPRVQAWDGIFPLINSSLPTCPGSPGIFVTFAQSRDEKLQGTAHERETVLIINIYIYKDYLDSLDIYYFYNRLRRA